MRPSRILWNVAVKAPIRVAGAMVALERDSRARELWSDAIKQGHKNAGKLTDNPPPVQAGTRAYRVIDLEEVWFCKGPPFLVEGADDFEDAVSDLDAGPVLVTLRLEAESRVAAYVNGRQVGWIRPIREREYLRWMRQMNEYGLLPRFKGAVRTSMTGKKAIGYFGSHSPNECGSYFSPKKLARAEERRRQTGN